jgi:hypothetical protein
MGENFLSGSQLARELASTEPILTKVSWSVNTPFLMLHRMSSAAIPQTFRDFTQLPGTYRKEPCLTGLDSIERQAGGGFREE